MMSGELKRYEIWPDHDGFVVDDNGEWVLYEDVKTLLIRERTDKLLTVKTLEARVESLKKCAIYDQETISRLLASAKKEQS